MNFRSSRRSAVQPAAVGVVMVHRERMMRDALVACMGSVADLECLGTELAAVASTRVSAVVMGGDHLGAELLDELAVVRARLPRARVALVVRDAEPSARTTADEHRAVVLPIAAGLHTLWAALRGDEVDTAWLWPVGDVQAPATVLSPREHEVLQLLAGGLNPDAIGRRLGISTNTSRGHVKSIRTKLGCTSALQAVTTAVRIGLLDDLQQG